MLGESLHSSSTATPQYDEIIQDLSSLCFQVSGESSGSNDCDFNAGFFRGCLGSQAYLQYSTWKTRRKSQQEQAINNSEEEPDEALLLLAKATTKKCLERIGKDSSTSSSSLSIWTNPIYGARALLTVIYHQLQLGEASYQQLDHVEDFLDQCITGFDDVNSIGSFNVMTGLAGTLQGIFFLRRELQRTDWAKKIAIRLGLELLKHGQRLSCAANENGASVPPLYWGESEIDWSISTGAAGILQTLLGLEMNEWNEIDKEIPNALESLLERTIHQLPPYGKMEFYTKNTSSSSWTLDGAAGHVILLLQAYVVLGSIDYLHQAQRLVQTVIYPRYLLCLNDMTRGVQEPLGLFDGLIGVCYSLWLIKERDAALKLTGVVIEHCKTKIKASDSLDVSLVEGAAGLIRLLQQLDSPNNGNGEEMEVPFLSSALFNFVLQTSKPLQDSDSDGVSWIRRGKKLSRASLQKASISSTEDSGHQTRKYYVSNLPKSSKSKRRASISDLDEDSHMSVSSFSVDEMQVLNSAPAYQKKDNRFASGAMRRSGRSMTRSVSSSSFSLKDSVREEDEDNSSSEHMVLSSLLGKDDGSESSSFSTSSHMENATVEDQADPDYLAKQDSDNEEYAYVNKSVSLLPAKDDLGSDSDSLKGSALPRAAPIDRLALFARTRRAKPALLQSDSDSDSIAADAPPASKKTPSTSNRKSLMSRVKPRLLARRDSSEDESSVDLVTAKVPSRSSRISMMARRGLGMLRKQKSVKRGVGLLDEEGHDSGSMRLDDGDDVGKDVAELQDAGADAQPDRDYLKMQDSQNIEYFGDSNESIKTAVVQQKALLDEEGHASEAVTKQDGENVCDGSKDATSFKEEDEYDDDGLAVGLPNEQASEAFLASQDISTRTRTVDLYPNYEPVSAQKKTLMDEEGHRNKKGNASTESHTFIRSSKRVSRVLEEAEDSGSESMDDEDEFNDDGLAIGLPNEQANEAFLAAQDISSRTRSVDLYPNYKPVSAQKKTLMDEEGHQKTATQIDPAESQLDTSNVLHDGNDSGSESMHDEDEFNDDDGLAIGLSTEEPSEAYLDSQDISSRSRTVDPYSEYKPVSVQKKTLMDEEGHGAEGVVGKLRSFDAGILGEGDDSGSESMHDDNEFNDDGLAVGQLHEQPSQAFLDAQDISSRTRTVDAFANYVPVSAQRKTLMDEEGHNSGSQPGNCNVLKEEEDCGSESMDDEDEFNDDDGLAIGLPNEQPSEAYLDTQDVSSRTRTVDPFSNYRPTSSQKKTLMDEEGHQGAPIFSNDPEFRSVCSLMVDSDMEDEPNTEYLAKQDSSSALYFEYKSKTTAMPARDILDEEEHLVPDTSTHNLSSESLLHDSDIDAEPNAEYLAKQNSGSELYYEFTSETTKMPEHQILDED